MRRIIIDYKKLDHHVAALLIDLYPHGYGDDDVIVLKKPNGEVVEAVEVTTEDTVYLVKISKSLSNFIANFDETIERELQSPQENETHNNEVLNADFEGDAELDSESDDFS